MNVADHDAIQRQAAYQVKKFNACRKCLKCESLCRAGAISIDADGYHIDPKKCVHCKMCVTAKYLDGGCTMDKYRLTLPLIMPNQTISPISMTVFGQSDQRVAQSAAFFCANSVSTQ